MRQGHQNRRGRNRNNGGARKGQNPVTRSYESNGPDMKIRGTPAHIAEKYIALSRDAQSNGDPVLAENYLQHAEHYNRIILAYRDAQAQQHSGEQPQGGPTGNGHQRPPANQDQPTADDQEQPTADAAEAAQPSGNGQAPTRRQSRGRHGDNRGRSQQRGRKPRNADGDSQDAGQDRRGDDGVVPEHEQPEFLRRSIRRPRRDAASETDAEAATPATEDSTQD